MHGLYVQDFVDTAKTRRPLGPFDAHNSAESFGISLGEQFITIAMGEQFFSIMVQRICHCLYDMIQAQIRR